MALLAPLLDPLHPGLIRAGALDTLAGVTSRIRVVTLQPLSHCTRVIEPMRLFSSPEAASAAQRDLMDPNTQAFYKGATWQQLLLIFCLILHFSLLHIIIRLLVCTWGLFHTSIIYLVGQNFYARTNKTYQGVGALVTF